MKNLILISFILFSLACLGDGRKNLKPKKVVFTEEEILSANSSTKGLPKGPNKRIKNPDFAGSLPNQVFIVTRGPGGSASSCTGTMLSSTIVLTAGHCVDMHSTPSDVQIFSSERKCKVERGISACKVKFQFVDRPCSRNGRDIALIKLSQPFNVQFSNIGLPFHTPVAGARTIMSGTGRSNVNTCQSLLSYQTAITCNCGPQWYCTRGTYKAVSGSCVGDSGGPSWSFWYGLTGVTSGAPTDSIGCTTGFTVFSNIAFYKDWIETTMRDFETC